MSSCFQLVPFYVIKPLGMIWKFAFLSLQFLKVACIYVCIFLKYWIVLSSLYMVNFQRRRSSWRMMRKLFCHYVVLVSACIWFSIFDEICVSDCFWHGMRLFDSYLVLDSVRLNFLASMCSVLLYLFWLKYKYNVCIYTGQICIVVTPCAYLTSKVTINTLFSFFS